MLLNKTGLKLLLAILVIMKMSYGFNCDGIDASSQQCSQSHPHFFMKDAAISYDENMGYQNYAQLNTHQYLYNGSGAFAGGLDFQNWEPENRSEVADWVRNDILDKYYSTYTNPVSWSGGHMKKTNGGDGGSTPGKLRFAFMIRVLKINDNTTKVKLICRNVVIARGDDNWWVFQNDGERPKDGPGLYCYRDTTSPTKQAYDVALLGGDNPITIDGEEIYPMKIEVKQHEEK